MLSKSDLKELRELFRTRMKEEDFCIGEYEVEKLFRELLEEPEPESIKFEHKLSEEDLKRLAEIRSQELERFAQHAKDLFERDDAFYKKLKK